MSHFKQQAHKLLKTALDNKNANFRDGQWEAIESLVRKRKRLLVVQRTGWGKSIVYFLSTRLLRDAGEGPTVVISPLLALIRNQVEAAERLGLNATTINSDNTADWPEIEAAFLNNQIDVLLISPERLANEKFRRGAFQVKSWPGIKGPVLLVDDMVDSRWTMTVVTALLRQAGSGPVYPLALANTAKG